VFNISNPFNIYQSEPDYFFAIYAAVILAVQDYILINQQKRGAFFFIPKMFRTNFYNYHKTKSEIVALNIDFNALECTICLKAFYEDTELNTINSSSSTNSEKDSSVLVDNDCYEKLMITPCKHVFHTECLHSWVAVKLECPICKQVLPYIE
jgi:hypothetical protein